MMRKVFAVALFTAMFGAASAQAGVTYDFVFRPGGGGTANGNQYTFTSTAAANAGQAIADVLLISSDALIAASVSIGFDTAQGLRIGSTDEWVGVNLGMMASFAPIAPGVVVDNAAGTASSYDGVALPLPVGPPSLAPGTYNIGTIVWDTSGASGGISSIFAFLEDGLDGTGGVQPPRSNNITELTGTEVLGSGFINIVPEPATAGLLGLGLAGLVLAGRRRRA